VARAVRCRVRPSDVPPLDMEGLRLNIRVCVQFMARGCPLPGPAPCRCIT
jgi:hypothetical protein